MAPKRKAATKAEKQNKKVAAMILYESSQSEDEEETNKSQYANTNSTTLTRPQTPQEARPTLLQRIQEQRRAQNQRPGSSKETTPTKLVLVNTGRGRGGSDSSSGPSQQDTNMSDVSIQHPQPQRPIAGPRSVLHRESPHFSPSSSVSLPSSPPDFGYSDPSLQTFLQNPPQPLPQFDFRRVTPTGFYDDLNFMRSESDINGGFNADIDYLICQDELPNPQNARIPTDFHRHLAAPQLPEFSPHRRTISSQNTSELSCQTGNFLGDVYSLVKSYTSGGAAWTDNPDDYLGNGDLNEHCDRLRLSVALLKLIERQRTSAFARLLASANPKPFPGQLPSPVWQDLAISKLKLAKEPRKASLFGTWNAPKRMDDEDTERCSFCLFDCDFGISDERTWLPSEAARGFCGECHQSSVEWEEEWIRMMDSQRYMCFGDREFWRVHTTVHVDDRRLEELKVNQPPPFRETGDRLEFTKRADEYLKERAEANGLAYQSGRLVAFPGHGRSSRPLSVLRQAGFPAQSNINMAHNVVPAIGVQANSDPKRQGARSNLNVCPGYANTNGNQLRENATAGPVSSPQQRLDLLARGDSNLQTFTKAGSTLAGSPTKSISPGTSGDVNSPQSFSVVGSPRWQQRSLDTSLSGLVIPSDPIHGEASQQAYRRSSISDNHMMSEPLIQVTPRSRTLNPPTFTGTQRTRLLAGPNHRRSLSFNGSAINMGPPPPPMRRTVSDHDGKRNYASRNQFVDFCRGCPWRQIDVFKTRICNHCRDEKVRIIKHGIHTHFSDLIDNKSPYYKTNEVKMSKKRCMICTDLAVVKCEGCPLRLCAVCEKVLVLPQYCNGILTRVLYYYRRTHIRNDAFLLRSDGCGY